MALHWNIKNCKNQKTLQSKTEWPITHNLIWATMSTGINEITEENWTEFYARIAAWEECVGAFSATKCKKGKYKEHPFTPKDIFKRIGLHTNASRMTRTQWQKNMGEYFGTRADSHKKAAENESHENP